MEVIVADNAGFCFGVKRAIKMANDTMDSGSRVKSLGSLIHNPQVVTSFRKRGLEVVADLDSVDPDDTVVIRSHGVGPELKNQATSLGLKVVDTTCPFVTKAQQYAAKLISDGYKVVMIGDKNHPEVIGVVAHTQNQAIVLDTVEEAEKLKFIPRMGVVFQTTHSIGHVQEVVGVLLIESAEELHEDWFQGLTRVGVSAGASTPDEVIAEVVERITNMEPTPA